MGRNEIFAGDLSTVCASSGVLYYPQAETDVTAAGLSVGKHQICRVVTDRMILKSAVRAAFKVGVLHRMPMDCMQSGRIV